MTANSRPLTVAMSCLVMLLSTIHAARADDSQELDSYMLCADEFVDRPVDEKDAVFYAYASNSLEAKLKEYGQKFPDNMNFPQGGLFILVIYDHVDQQFVSVSSVAATRQLVVDLSADKDAKPRRASDDKHKTSRMLLVCCPPLRGIRSFSLKTADGVRHDVASADKDGDVHP
jgi:hypothetical protein